MVSRAAREAYYLSCDLDNFETARSLAAAVGIDLELLFPRDLPAPAGARAVLVDLDFLGLDARGRRRFLKELPALYPGIAVAAHGYDFDAVLPAARRAALVARKLTVPLLLALLDSAAAPREAA